MGQPVDTGGIGAAGVERIKTMTIAELAAELAEATLVDEEHISVWTDDHGVHGRSVGRE